ncbi:hypothetical protein GBQ70_13990 [Halomicrobium sp. ZPS1]|uniref:DUF7847 domain-containing protein n=1 Tax=Halomicrobium mukohataei TaxID=57705 RepID=A0A4D6KG00_9EURY|nr:hypothetical protein E5139_13975 [Halomicrobium mukohataei]QFR21503.1 hypothetical protein GBQ70_13990 [Halomicrobium sp. ZPS1]
MLSRQVVCDVKPTGALSTGIDTLRRQPQIVAILFAFSLLSTGLSAVQFVNPLLAYPATGVVYLLLPFLVGGLVAYVAASMTDSPSFEQFLAAGRDHYVGLLLGGLLLGVVTLVVYVLVAIVFFVAVVLVFGAALNTGLGAATLSVVVLLSLVGFLVVLVPWFFSQFFPAAMVLDGDGVADSFRRSVSLVRSNAVSVVGFDLIAFVIGLLVQTPTAFLFYSSFDSMALDARSRTGMVSVFDYMSTTEVGLFLGSSLVISTVVGSIMYAYYVAYYREIGDASSAATDTTRL